MRFAVFCNAGSGDHFIRELYTAGLFPVCVVSQTPTGSGGGGIKQFLKKSKMKIRMVFQDSWKYEFVPYYESLKRGIPVYDSADVNSKEFAEMLRSLNLDYLFVFTFKILKKHVLDSSKKGVINFHPSLLPVHRGPSPTFWTIKNGDKTAGFSVHYIAEKIDGGEIIVQEELPVGENEDSAILLERLLYTGAKSFTGLVNHLRHGKPTSKPNDIESGSYEKSPRPEDMIIDESMHAEQIRRIVLASAAYGGARWKQGDRIYNVLSVQKMTGEYTDAENESSTGVVFLKSSDAILFRLSLNNQD